jgi:ABC-type transporter Mla subunit MlaD
VSSKSSSPTPRQLTRAEQEVQTAAERLTSQMDDALAAVSSIQSPDAAGELEAVADRLERAARDMSVALRELAEQRGSHARQ